MRFNEIELPLPDLIIQSEDFIISAFDTKLNCIYVNKSLANITGSEPSDLIGNTLKDLFKPEDSGQVLEAANKCLIEQDSQQISQIRILAKASSFRLIKAEFFKLRSDNSKPEGIVMVGKLLSKKPMEEKPEIWQTLNNLDKLAWTVDTEGIINHASEAWHELSIHPGSDLVGKKLLGLIHPDETERVQDSLTRCAGSSENICRLQYRFKDGLGGWAWHETNLKPLSNGLVLGITRDISEPQTLSVKKGNHIPILPDLQSFYVIRLNLQGEYNYANQKYLATFGYNYLKENGTYEYKGVYAFNSVYKDDVSVVQNAIKKLHKHPSKVVQTEIRKLLENGDIGYTLWDMSFISDENRIPVEILCIGIDNTETKAMEYQEILLKESEQNHMGLVSLIEDNEEINKALNRNLKFQQAISEVSTSFVRTTQESFVSDVEQMLEKAGSLFNALRAYLLLLTDDSESISAIHEWSNSNVEPLKKGEIQKILTSNIKDLKSKLERENFVHLIDDDVTFSSISKSRSESTLLLIPIRNKHQIWGLIGFEIPANSELWPDEHLNGLKVLANIVAELLQKQEAEQRLQAAREELYKTVLEITKNVEIGMWSMDMDDNILFMNDATESITGHTVEEWHQNPELWEKVYLGSESDIVENARTEVMQSGSHERLQKLITKHGEQKTVKIQHKLVKNKQGKPIRIDSTSTDITKIIAYQRRLEQLNDELNAFSYTISHDLRAPLRSIEGYTEIIKEEYSDKLDDSGKHFLNRIQSSSQKMSELINDLLELSRLSTKSTDKRKIDISYAAAQTMEMLQESFNLDSEKLSCTIEPKMYGMADPTLIKLVLQNLLQNAIKYSAEKGDIAIHIGKATINERETFYVSDSGVGFDMRYVDKLFKPFQRLHSKSLYSGTGIGLAIVKRVIDKHDGQIWAESEVNKGSTFYFTLG
ncbi:MAG: PAS domain-containing protein [Balneolia bacterium]|nr:PAS domain-containing protein [Balneolia bacterium]